MKHTESCLRTQKAANDWVAKWPNHCKTCYGRGSWYDPGNRDQPPDGGPCSCVEEGKCPRCGEQITEYRKDDSKTWDSIDINDHVRCDHCGWKDDEPDICPDVDCYCWEDGGEIGDYGQVTDPNVRSILDIHPKQSVMEKLYNLLGPWTARGDNEVRYEAYRIVCEELGLDPNFEEEESSITILNKYPLDERCKAAFEADDDDDPCWDEKTGIGDDWSPADVAQEHDKDHGPQGPDEMRSVYGHDWDPNKDPGYDDGRITSWK